MQFLRRLGLGLSASLFTLLLVLFALCITIYAVLDTPDSLKKALHTSGIYNVVVDRMLTQKQQQGELALPATDEGQAAVRQATQQALSPAFLQQTTEQSLDQAYDWLHGRTKQPGLTIDVSAAKQRFADSLAAHVQQRAADLPACTQPALPPTTLDGILALSCRPAELSAEMLAAGARQEALKSRLFDQLKFTTADLQDSRGRPLDQKLEDAPRAHRYFILSLFIIPLLLGLLATAIIFGSATRRSGMKRIAHILLWTGLSNVVWAVVAMWGLNRLGANLGGSGEVAALQSNILQGVNSLASDLRAWWAGMGAGYVVIGIGLLFGVHLLGKRSTHEAEALNKSLGYNSVPSAGTTFDPDKKTRGKPSASPTKTAADARQVLQNAKSKEQD